MHEDKSKEIKGGTEGKYGKGEAKQKYQTT